MSISTVVSPLLENLAYLAQIASMLSIVFVAWQVKISLRDIRTRTIREAYNLSVQHAEKFANDIVPEVDSINDVFKSKGVTLEKNKFFSYSELQKELLNSKKAKHLLFDVLKNDVELVARISTVLNKLEAMSMSFVNGVADESVAFVSLSSVFCSTIEEYSFIISLKNVGNEIKPYQNLLRLYKIWSERLEKDRLGREITILRDSVRKIKDEKVSPIGVSVE